MTYQKGKTQELNALHTKQSLWKLQDSGVVMSSKTEIKMLQCNFPCLKVNEFGHLNV